MQRVQPNKGYGQHFLRDEAVLLKTLEIIQKHYTGGTLLEIGPGMGALTKHLLKAFGEKLRCVEIDERCVEYLKAHYPALEQQIIQKDFLKTDLDSLLQEQTILTGNFPYNISSQIVFRMLEFRDRIPAMVGMFQKEVAERIAASHGNKDYGILSVLAQAYYDAEVCFDIPPGAFAPPPKVMSSVLLLKRKIHPEYIANEALLARIVKAGFNQRRKMLRNALSGVLPPEMLTDPFFQQRAEQVSVKEFIALSNRVQAHLAD